MMQPAQLLEDLGVVGRVIENPLVCSSGTLELQIVTTFASNLAFLETHIFLLLMDVTNLEPDVFLSQRTRR